MSFMMICSIQFSFNGDQLHPPIREPSTPIRAMERCRFVLMDVELCLKQPLFVRSTRRYYLQSTNYSSALRSPRYIDGYCCTLRTGYCIVRGLGPLLRTTTRQCPLVNMLKSLVKLSVVLHMLLDIAPRSGLGSGLGPGWYMKP